MAYLNKIQVMADNAPYRLPPFPALRAFHAAARHERLADAAAELGITESAVSHQIRKLEDFVQQRLFDRRGNGRELTPVGERFFAGLDPAFVQLAEATREVMGKAQDVGVSITVSPSLAVLWLIPRLAEFEQAHPDVRLNLVTTSQLVDLRRDRIDLAIRYGGGRWPGVEAELLMSELAMPVCSPTYFGDGSVTDPQSAILNARLITSSYYTDEWEEWARARRLKLPESNRLRFDTYEQATEATVQGLGISLGRKPMVDGRIANGSLIAPFGLSAESATKYYLCHAAGSELSAMAKHTARWLKETAASIT